MAEALMTHAKACAIQAQELAKMDLIQPNGEEYPEEVRNALLCYDYNPQTKTAPNCLM